jgi:hypothetical protein
MFELNASVLGGEVPIGFGIVDVAVEWMSAKSLRTWA